MKHGNSTTIRAGLVALANVLLCARVSIGGVDAASTNTVPSANEQTVVVLERMGRYEEAEAQCIQLLHQNPSDPAAQRLLAEIEERKHPRNPRADLRGQVDDIVIPEVDVREAGVADVIKFLQTESQRVSGAESPINVVWEAPEDFKTAKVTLNLRRVPLADALKYVTESAGLRYHVDSYAVVIYQPPTESSSSNVKSP